MTVTDDHVVDILDDGPEDAGPARAGRLPTPRALYDRWEKQQWSIAEVDVRRDRESWQQLRSFARGQLFEALAELEVGEVFVSRTLSGLVTHAPTDEDRLYLSTQVADEARHAQFFQDYLHLAVGEEQTVSESGTQDADSAYGRYFEPQLRASIDRVHELGGDRAAWHTAIVEYHLVTEGVLAAAALQSTRQLARRFELAALEEGLGNVARDESRHLTYGLAATRRLVDSGQADPVFEIYRSGVVLAARVLVNPAQKAVAPVLRPALVARAAQVSAQWHAARTRAVRQLRLIGLADRHQELAAAWDAACDRAMDEYAANWGVKHPVAVVAENA
ncbi:ribonucleotide-diphosphate reductase subunit beta [Kitasatospora sp. NPDC097643]|uniref:ribonucleotide-diphosphate reductase subunit beta n=1 Tax=Kitasatospora sp. NPDC097643 TaxID=3157230 RepID=UPI00331BC4A9